MLFFFYENLMYNNVILYGKIVNFDMSLGDVIQKINEKKDIKHSNKHIYTLDTIVGKYVKHILYINK